MELEHDRREPGSETFCDCGAQERMREWMKEVGHQAVLRMDGSGNRFHTERCALRQSPDGRPYTTTELDAAKVMEMHIMAHDGGLIDFREVARELIMGNVLDDPADVLMRAAERIWSALDGVDPFAHDAIQATLRDPGRHRHACVLDHGREPDNVVHECSCGERWTT